MRRGTQGHVAAPHGPTRRLRDEEVTRVHVFIFIINIGLSYI